jgi:hypothetical protein
MTRTIVDAPRRVTGGVDTHLDVNVAAALDQIGGLLAVAEFPATAAGHRQLLSWLAGFGPVARVGVEGTGSYGAGLSRHLRAAGVEVVEVDRPNRQARRRAGKSDPLDAIEAARAALSGRASGAAKTRDGNVEAIRARSFRIGSRPFHGACPRHRRCSMSQKPTRPSPPTGRPASAPGHGAGSPWPRRPCCSPPRTVPHLALAHIRPPPVPVTGLAKPGFEPPEPRYPFTFCTH